MGDPAPNERLWNAGSGQASAIVDLLLEANDQVAVGSDQRLLGFDLPHDGLLRGEGRKGNRDALHDPAIREMLEEIRRATLTLVERFQPDFGGLVLPEGPEREILAAVTSIIAPQATP